MSSVRVAALVAALTTIGATSGSPAVPAAASGSSSPAVPVPAWPPATDPDATVQHLHREYDQIFLHGNRNAASHRWTTFLLDRAAQMAPERMDLMFSGFCAVSGSPVRPSDYNRYRLTLPRLGGGLSTGYMHYCCWPCVCDTQDFIRIDTRNVTNSDGVSRQFQFVVIGNPCDRPEQLNVPFVQPFDKRQTSIADSAREVRCLPGGVLEGATMSDHGYVIINRFFDATDATPDTDGVSPGALAPIEDPTPGRISTGGDEVQFQDEREFAPRCGERAANGYNSGMGEIFRRVCSVSPVSAEALNQNTVAAAAALGSGGAKEGAADEGGSSPEAARTATCEDGNLSACPAAGEPPQEVKDKVIHLLPKDTEVPAVTADPIRAARRRAQQEEDAAAAAAGGN